MLRQKLVKKSARAKISNISEVHIIKALRYAAVIKQHVNMVKYMSQK